MIIQPSISVIFIVCKDTTLIFITNKKQFHGYWYSLKLPTFCGDYYFSLHTVCYLTVFQNLTEQVGLQVTHVFEMFTVQISARTLATLTENFHNFPWSSQANVGILPWLHHNYFLSNPFKFISHSTIWCWVA